MTEQLNGGRGASPPGLIHMLVLAWATQGRGGSNLVDCISCQLSTAGRKPAAHVELESWP